MRLVDALDNYRAAREGAGPFHWRQDGTFGTEDPGPCSHSTTQDVIGEDGQPKRNRKGAVITKTKNCRLLAVTGHEVCRQHGGPKQLSPGRTSGKTPDPYRLNQLLADIDRCIDALPKVFRSMFDLLYRQSLPLGPTEVAGDWTAARETARVNQIMHQLGYREQVSFWRHHDRHLNDMQRRLIDYFPEARDAA